MFDKSLKEQQQNEEKNNQLLAITQRGFYSLVSSQTEFFHASIVCKSLNKLKPENKNFDEEYNKIIFGGMVYESAMEADKYCLDDLYPLMCHELKKLCDIEFFNSGEKEDLARGAQLIKVIGEKVLAKELEFTIEHLNLFFDRSFKYVNDSLPGGCQNREQHKEDFLAFRSALTERYLERSEDLTVKLGQ